MPFTVGQYLSVNDLKSQEDAHTLGYGVVSGLKVVPTDPASMDVLVETGKAYVADTLVEKGTVTPLTVSGADPTNPRKDIVVCNSAGTLSIVAGTAEAALPSGKVGVYTLKPEPPNIPANSIILAEIWIPAGATEITGSEIYDKRVSIADFIGHKDAATGVHGVGASTVCSETEVVPIVEAAGLALASGKNIKIEEALSTNDTWAGITCDGTAGETLALGDVCYLKSDGKFWKADADAVTTMPVVAMATATINAEASGVFLLQGYIRHDTWTWTIGGVLYADTVTAGGMTQTIPSGTGDQVQELGVALTADIVRFNPIQTLVEVS